MQDSNVNHRQKYASDPEPFRKASRNHYRKENPLPVSKLGSGLLCQGEDREVIDDEMEVPTVVEAFTIPEAAKALGRSDQCRNKWIKDDLVPGPVLRDTTYNYRQYSVGELSVIARILLEHEQELTYYSNKHVQTIHKMHQAVQGYRAQYI